MSHLHEKPEEPVHHSTLPAEKSTIRKAAETTGEKIVSGYENLTSKVTHAAHSVSETLGIPQSVKVETGNMRLKYKHPTYTFVDTPKEADGVAWAFVDHFTMGKFFFKFPELRPEEIRIDVTFLGICHSDTMFVQEDLMPIKNYPIAPGHEIVGIVKAVGSSVKDFQVGDRVGFGFQRWACGKCKECSMS
jgi:hypothetical protein